MVLPSELDELWPQAEPLIRRGLQHVLSRYDPEDVKESVRNGWRQLWLLVPDMACVWVTQIDTYPRSKVLHIFLIAGRMPPDWKQVLFHVEQWGKAQGCQSVELKGRKGWVRRLPDYQVPRVFMQKDLTHA